MFGVIFIGTYLVSMGYNLISLNKIRKDINLKCKNKLIEAGFQLNENKYNSIIECSDLVDDIGIIFCSYLPFTNFFISYDIFSGKLKEKYERINESILDYDNLVKLSNMEIIPKVNLYESEFKKISTCIKKSKQEKVKSNFNVGNTNLLDKKDKNIIDDSEAFFPFFVEDEIFVNYEENLYELGGFAENPEDVDGDFEIFNRCLAEEYLTAMVDENFLELGELSVYLLETIYRWNNLSEIDSDKFFNGTFKTNKNRTFIDAITKTHAYKAGEAYLHVNNPKFLAMMIAYSELCEYTLRYQEHQELNNDEWNKLVQETLQELNVIYESLDDRKKIELLEKVKITISNITVPKHFEPCKVPSNSLTKKLIRK